MGTLAGGVAHDMNNVLAVVLGLGSALENEMGLHDPKTSDIREIVAAARRGKSLVENLLGFARKGNYQKEWISLNECVRGLVEVLNRTVSKKVVINTSLHPQLEMVECDSSLIAQVIMNLCVNAADAISDSGAITVSTSNEVLGERDLAAHPKLEAGRYIKLQFPAAPAYINEP